jgi:hypothetical protein
MMEWNNYTIRRVNCTGLKLFSCRYGCEEVASFSNLDNLNVIILLTVSRRCWNNQTTESIKSSSNNTKLRAKEFKASAYPSHYNSVSFVAFALEQC